jgi:hypothetical protein
MAHEKHDEDALMRRASDELGVDEGVVRQFVARNAIDVAAAYEEKRQVMERKATGASRRMVGGVVRTVHDFRISARDVES